MNKYRYYLKPSTRMALRSFERNLPNMGRIVKIRGTYSLKRWYRVHLWNESGDKFTFMGAQAEAMFVGSMFGWNVPGADPDHYDEEGKVKRT